MTTNNAPPSGNPAGRYDLRSLLRLWWIKNLQMTDNMLPAQVIAYDATTNMVQVQPLITVVTTDNQIVNRAQIPSIPVLQLSGGGFLVNFPITSGDLGWVHANDRDISLFIQTGEMSPPNTQRKHSFEDAIFIPQAARSLITIAEEDADNLVIQNYAGTIKISLSETAITITAPENLNLTAPNINISASTKLSLHSGANVSFDADGTGVVYTPSLITSYTDGVATAHDAPNPPGPL